MATQDRAPLYKLLPRKKDGFFVVVLASNEDSIQFRSTVKRNCLDWLDDNQPAPAAVRLNAQVSAPVWRGREAA